MPRNSQRRKVCSVLLCKCPLSTVLLRALLGRHPLLARTRVPQTPRQGGDRPTPSHAVPLVVGTQLLTTSVFVIHDDSSSAVAMMMMMIMMMMMMCLLCFLMFRGVFIEWKMTQPAIAVAFLSPFFLSS